MNLTNFIKYNKTAYRVYYYVMSFLINVLKLFVKSDEKLILFNSFAGRKYDDSPKVIFETMKTDLRFKGFRFVWAFHEPKKFQVEGAHIIKTNGLAYFKTALSARVWITNSSVERGLNFKGKKTFYLNTWHGSPIKKMGIDIALDNKSFRSKNKNKIDVMNTQSLYEANIFTKCFGIRRECFIDVGLPRNDALVKYSEEDRFAIRKKLGLPVAKKIILYCPTFREYEKDDNLGVVHFPPMNLKKWEETLGNQYVLLFRAHYEVSKVMKINDNAFVKDFSTYPTLNDLMIVSDVLVSDYSSIFFDYSVMDKCMIHFTYDFDTYESKRGMYFDIRSYLSGSASEDGVISILRNLNVEKEKEKTSVFRQTFMNFYGDATKKTVDCIAAHLKL